MDEYKWFKVSVESSREAVVARLQEVDFQQEGEEYVDVQGRRVTFIDTSAVKIGIPPSEFIAEQEQLEFLVGTLGLDIDTVQQV